MKLSSLQPAQLLIIDDDADILLYLSETLKSEEYDIQASSTGKRGIQIAEQEHPDLILLDVLMPGMNGFEVCEQLKHNEQTKNIPIIFLTAVNDREAIIRAFELGAVDYITKPFDQRELLVRVHNHATLALIEKCLRHEVQVRTHKLDHANNQLKALASELVLSEERERRTLAENLHDSTLQKLAMAHNHMLAVSDNLPGERGVMLSESLELIDASITELRSLIFDLSPPILYDFGLSAAFKQLTHLSGKRFPFKLELRGDATCSERLDKNQAVLLFRSVHELLANVRKHANAAKVWIETRCEKNLITVMVSDDGEGFDVEQFFTSKQSEYHFGLFSIKQRMEQLDGDFAITSNAQGTQATLRLNFDG